MHTDQQMPVHSTPEFLHSPLCCAASLQGPISCNHQREVPIAKGGHHISKHS